MKKNSLNLVIVALCLVSFVRGAYRLGEQSMWWDESLSHYRATQPIPFILSNQIMDPLIRFLIALLRVSI